eukprot:365679-Chlamydomonas_euryale.AAC.33
MPRLSRRRRPSTYCCPAQTDGSRCAPPGWLGMSSGSFQRRAVQPKERQGGMEKSCRDCTQVPPACQGSREWRKELREPNPRAREHCLTSPGLVTKRRVWQPSRPGNAIAALPCIDIQDLQLQPICKRQHVEPRAALDLPDLKPGKLSLTLEAERAGEVGAQPSPSFGVRACSACTEPMLPVSRLSHMLERGTRGKLSPCATAADFSTATSHALIPPALLPVTTLAPRASKAVRRLLCARIMCCGRVHVGSLPWPMRTMPMLALGSAHMASLPSSSPRIMQSSAWQTLMLTTGGPWGPTAHTADTRPLLRSHNRQSPPAWPVSRRQPRASGALDCGTSERQLTATITEHMPYLLKLMEPSWVASDARRRCSVHAAVAAVTVSCFARMAVTGVPGCGASLAP